MQKKKTKLSQKGSLFFFGDDVFSHLMFDAEIRLCMLLAILNKASTKS